MSKKLKDGSVVSSYWKVQPKLTGQDIKEQGGTTLIGQIEKIHFVDDATNISKQFVEYDVSVRNQQGGQTIYKNVRADGDLGGFNDSSDVVLEANEVALKGQLDPSNFFGNKNGTIVYISFRDDSLDKPYISGTAEHPQNKGSTRADGIRWKKEFRGLVQEINKEGEYILTYQSNKLPNGRLVRPESGPSVFKIDKTGKISHSSVNESVTHEIDGANEAITMRFKSGLIVTVDGAGDKVDITTAGGTNANIDGSADSVKLTTSAGGKVTIDAASKVVIEAGTIELGEGAAESVVLGDTFKSIYDSHIHPTGVGPSGPPTLPLPASVLSDQTKAQK